MQTISIEQLKKKYPESYSDLLLRLGIGVYNNQNLMLSGIRRVEVFTTAEKQYYRYYSDLEDSPFSAPADWKQASGAGFKDKYILTIASSGKYKKRWTGGGEDGYQEERMEYAVYIQNRKAEYGSYTGDLVRHPKELIELFLAALAKLINIDEITVVVFKKDKPFIDALRKIGFEISGKELKCYKVTKIIQQPLAALGTGD